MIFRTFTVKCFLKHGKGRLLAHPVRAFAPCWRSPAAARGLNPTCCPLLHVIPYLSPPFFVYPLSNKGKSPQKVIFKKKKRKKKNMEEWSMYMKMCVFVSSAFSLAYRKGSVCNHGLPYNDVWLCATVLI